MWRTECTHRWGDDADANMADHSTATAACGMRDEARRVTYAAEHGGTEARSRGRDLSRGSVSMRLQRARCKINISYRSAARVQLADAA
eukprot:1925058-Rhodomonas_salina.2